MKNILSILLCFLLIQPDAWALRGGPHGAGTGGVAGQYSGILVENAGADMGLFLLTANVSGPSSGQLVIFSQGPTNSAVFNCKLVGLSDSAKGGHLFGLFVGGSEGSDNIAFTEQLAGYQVITNPHALVSETFCGISRGL